MRKIVKRMSNQETIETVEGQILHAKLIKPDDKSIEKVCGSYDEIKEYCHKNNLEVEHFYNYSELDSIPGGGYFKHV